MVSPILKEMVEQVPDAIPRGMDVANMEFRPWPGRFLVKREDPEEVTRGGIHLPQTSLEKKAYGKVISVGDGCKNVGVGDLVLFIDHSGYPMTMLGEGYELLDAADGADCDVLGTFLAKT